MSEATPPIDEDDAALAELVAKDLDAVRHAHAQLMATTEPDVLNGLMRSYQRASRSLRQTIALKAELKRKAAQAAALAPKPADDFDALGFAIDARIEDIQDAVGRVIHAAAPGDRARRDQLYERFDREADDWALDADWLDEHVDDQIVGVCAMLDLPADLAAAWRKLPIPDYVPDPVEATAGPPSAEAPPPPWSETG